jgi:hypothetical protein
MDNEALENIENQRMNDRVKQTRSIYSKDSLTANQIGERDRTSGYYQVNNQSGVISPTGIKIYNSVHSLGDTVAASKTGNVVALDGALAATEKRQKTFITKESFDYTGIGDRGQNDGYINGQRWNFPDDKPKEDKGLLMWLDCNWLFFSRVIQIPKNNLKFFEKILKYFLGGNKKLYTLLASDERIYDEYDFPYFAETGLQTNFSYSLTNISLRQELNKLNYEIIEKTIEEMEEIDRPFFMPLLKQAATLTDDEFRILKKLSRNRGVMLCGEWQTWTEYDNRIIRGLGVREGVNIPYTTDGVGFVYSNYYDVVANKLKLKSESFEGNANNQFIGLKKNEIIVKSALNQAIFALFKGL